MTDQVKMSLHIEEWELKHPFRITGKEWTSFKSIVVHLVDEDCLGRGEAQGVFYIGEDIDSIFEQAHGAANEIRQGLSREELQDLLPAGGARNAIDCAMWDLECKKTGRSIWELTGIKPKAVTTAFTIGLEASPELTAEKAVAAANAPVLKIKLDNCYPYEKLAAIRAARPDATLVVDANQAWDFELLKEVVAKCADIGLDMIEQPLPRGKDKCLEGFNSPIMLAADESCLHTGELDVASKRYDMINIKLDKTGGLTEALKLACQAKKLGRKLMVGNMGGTSLSMAPSFVVAQLCDFADIDGPLILKYDHPQGLVYKNGLVEPFNSSFWG